MKAILFLKTRPQTALKGTTEYSNRVSYNILTYLRPRFRFCIVCAVLTKLYLSTDSF